MEMRHYEESYHEACERWKTIGQTFYRNDEGELVYGPTQAENLENEFKWIVLKCEQLKLKHFGARDKDHIWIGINPPVDFEKYSLVKLQKLMQSFFKNHKYTMLSDYAVYCVEQHTDNGVRPHIHFMAVGSYPTKTKPNRWIEHLSKHFKIEPNFIELKIYKKNYLLEEHKDYIKGIKRETKQDHVAEDHSEREFLGLSHFYEIYNIADDYEKN